MRRIVGLVVVGGAVAILACDATSPVAPHGQSVIPAQPATNFVPSIAFESDRDGSRSIYVANEVGTGVARLVPGESPAWSRDGSRIAYYWVGDASHPAGIYVVEADGSKQRWLVAPQNLGLPGVSWGPGDREVAYRGNGGIFAIAADGSAQPRKLIGDDVALPRPEGWNANEHDPGWVQQPIWSPDGDRIAFLRVDPLNWDWGADRYWYVINADGSNPRLLGRSCLIPPPGTGSLPCPVTSLAWSPSGASLAVTSYDVDAQTGSFDAVLGIMPAIFDPDAADSLDILYRGPAGDPQWSPDSSAIIFSALPEGAYAANTGGARIMVVSLDRRVVAQLIPDVAHPVLAGYSDAQPVWRRLADTCVGIGCWDY